MKSRNKWRKERGLKSEVREKESKKEGRKEGEIIEDDRKERRWKKIVKYEEMHEIF